MIPMTYTPQQQIENALKCLAGVAKLRLQHGGWPVSNSLDTSRTMRVARASRGERVKAPKRGRQIKRTIRGLR